MESTNSTQPTPRQPETKSTKVEEKKSNKNILIILLALSGVLNGVLFWLYWQERGKYQTVVVEKNTIVTEKEDVKEDLLKLQEDFSTLQTSDAALQVELDQKKEQIAQMIVEAEKHKNDAYYIAKLKKETNTLRDIMKGYIKTIDSLGTLNKSLYSENIKVKSNLLSEKEKAELLSKEKDELQSVINQGSILTANSMKAWGVILRSGGKKEVETSKARKAERIKVSVVVGENKLAKKGKRDLYLRVLTPDGKELARGYDDANSFTFNGTKGFFCDMTTMTYENASTTVYLSVDQKNGFVAGKYIVQVFCEGAQMGETTLTLD